jgi:hypothetical protein
VGGANDEDVAVDFALLMGTHTPFISTYPILQVRGFNAFEEYTLFIFLYIYVIYKYAVNFDRRVC